MSSYRDKYSSSSSGRRDSHSQSRRDDYRRRSPSPASSSGRSSESSNPTRSDKALPEQFGKVASAKKEDDDSTVLQCMRRSFDTNPLGCLTKCMKSDTLKLKVWTRNYKEIRGICTGTVIAFDKHWNMILSDVKEVYLKPKKAKTPFLSPEKEAKDLPELPPKEPKKKKDASAAAEAPKPETAPAASDPAMETTDGKEPVKKKDKRKKKKRRTNVPTDRSMDLCFIRGDNIVMAAVVEVQSEGEEEND